MSCKNLPFNLEFVREDDFVEYFVFPKLSKEAATAVEADQTQWAQLTNEMLSALQQSQQFIEETVLQQSYIWHKDEFQLQIRTGSAQERMLNEETNATFAEDTTVPLPPHLHGVTHYGDNNMDEWFIVYLLTELTKKLAGSIARVIDSDGEFLLIEAADFLPNWANPETCDQRVYLWNGELHLVQSAAMNAAKLMPVATAVNKIRQDPTEFRVSKEIQKCINERFAEFKDAQKSKALYHNQIVRLPLGVAALLKLKPKLISAAVRAFCDRDTIDVRACRSMRYFPPEQRVRVNVRFTRCLYAMLMHSNYVPDRKIGWNLSSNINAPEYKEDLLGIKIASGFEILASQAKESLDQQNTPAWRAYVKSLTSKGYFRAELEGSAEYQRLLEEARAYFNANNERFCTAALVGRDIIQLLRATDVNADQLRDEENNLEPSEPDDWLNISAEQLDAMLLERYGPKQLYKANGDLNAAEFTKNIAEFLEKESNYEGIDSDDDTPDEDEASTSDGLRANLKKNKSMRKACRQNMATNSNNNASSSKTTNQRAAHSDEDGISTHISNFLDFVIPEDKWDSNSEMSDYEDDDIEHNFEHMSGSAQHKKIDADIRAYMAEMDKELARTTIGKSFAASAKNSNAHKKKKQHTSASGDEDDDDFDDIESFKPININVNTLKNMMDSYKSQLGGTGPVSNLLSAMGVGMSAAVHQQNETGTEKMPESTV